MTTLTAPLTGDVVAAVDSTTQVAAILDLGAHLRDALDRVETAGLPPMPAPGGVVVAGMGGSAVGGDSPSARSATVCSDLSWEPMAMTVRPGE